MVVDVCHDIHRSPLRFWARAVTLTAMYEGRSISSRTVTLIKHIVNIEKQNYYDVVPPLMYATYRGFISVSYTHLTLPTNREV